MKFLQKQPILKDKDSNDIQRNILSEVFSNRFHLSTYFREEFLRKGILGILFKHQRFTVQVSRKEKKKIWSLLFARTHSKSHFFSKYKIKIRHLKRHH